MNPDDMEEWLVAQGERLVMVFLLLNVFFGVTGTFWMRTQARRVKTGTL